MKIGKFEVNKKLFITFAVVVGLTIILLLLVAALVYFLVKGI